MEPAVSILLPVRDGGELIEEALASLQQQTFGDFEIIVVDDGSTDDTALRVERLRREDRRITLLRRPPRGIVSALNEAASVARGAFLARLDADDLALPQRLQRQLELLSARPEVVAVGSLVEPLGPSQGAGWERYLRWLNSVVSGDQIQRELLVESPLAHPSVTLRRQAFEAVGGYRDIDGPEDYDLWLRLVLAGGKLAKVDEVLLRWRDLPSRLTRTDSRYRSEAFIRLKAHFLAHGPLVGQHRPLLIWGAGRCGRHLGRALERYAITPEAYLDIDVKKIGRTRRGQPVLSVDEGLSRYPQAQVLGAVPVFDARPLLRTELTGRGQVEGRDFWLCG